MSAEAARNGSGAAPHVELRRVTKRYGPVTAISDLSLTVEKGSFTALLGPSGCGKSTLLRMIAGLEEITAGQCFIDGVDVTDVAAGAAPHRDGVPVLRALSAHDGQAEHRLLALGRRRAEKGPGRARARSRAHPAARALSRSPAGRAFGRPAPAGRDRPGAGAQAGGLPVRRAAVQSRRQAAGANAPRTRQAPRRSRHDDDLRHARPDRGDDARRQDRRSRQGNHFAGRLAARALQRAGEQVRRRVHRLAEHEFLRRRDRRDRTAARRRVVLPGGRTARVSRRASGAGARRPNSAFGRSI